MKRVALPQVGNWFVLAVLVLWLVVQYLCHWHFTIFGAAPEKIRGYNQCFERQSKQRRRHGIAHTDGVFFASSGRVEVYLVENIVPHFQFG